VHDKQEREFSKREITMKSFLIIFYKFAIRLSTYLQFFLHVWLTKHSELTRTNRKMHENTPLDYDVNYYEVP